MNAFLINLRQLLLGKPRNPLNPDTQRRIALIAILAWIGLGADGLSSACYGPEEAFLALGSHVHLALYIAAATAITVFVIALAYNQVIELFPSGGGGYKVASQLLGPHAGLVSGAALIVDYVLTITLSIASAADALFSLLPYSIHSYKLLTEVGIILLLIALNLRGMKESILVLVPIFLGFVVIHTTLILYGIFYHSFALPTVLADSVTKTHTLSQEMGWFFLIGLMIRSYSLGSGTYTGIEAVSNNVNRLAEPRVETGKWTMLYMAISLSFTAGGIILLYLLWHATPVANETLNAVVFHKILGDSHSGKTILYITMLVEAGLLFVAGNTGFLAGPSVLANMAIDNWVPSRFRHLSSRLVTQNGIVLFGLAAILLLLWSQGRVAWLVILYSMNVFLTFSISILGLCVYWWQQKRAARKWLGRFIFTVFAFFISSGILLVTLISKFSYGGWITVVVTSTVIIFCLFTKNYYHRINQKLEATDILLHVPPALRVDKPPILDPHQPTAIIFIGEHQGVGVHTMLWVLRMFPGHFKNFIFIAAGIVDVESFSGKHALDEMQHKLNLRLNYFVKYCQQRGIAAAGYATYGTDPAAQLTELAEKVGQKYLNSIFFASKLTFEHDNWFTRWLHNETAYSVQRRLHLRNMQLVVLPMRIG